MTIPSILCIARRIALQDLPELHALYHFWPTFIGRQPQILNEFFPTRRTELVTVTTAFSVFFLQAGRRVDSDVHHITTQGAKANRRVCTIMV